MKFRIRFCWGIFVLLIVGIAQTLNGQGARLQDELKKLKFHVKEDTTRVNLLNDIAYAYHLVQIDSCLKYSKEAEQLATRLSYLKGIAKAMGTQAIANYLMGNVSETVSLNEATLKIHRKTGDKRGEAAILNNIAIVYHNEGKIDLARTYYFRSLKLRKEIGDSKGIADCLNNLGNSYTDNGNYVESLSYLFEALVIRERMGDSVAISNSLANIAEVYSNLKKFEDARKHSERAYEIQKRVGDEEGMFHSEIIIGKALLEEKKDKEALFIFNRSYERCKRLEDLGGLSVCMKNFGKTYERLGKIEEASRWYAEGLLIDRKYKDLQGVSISENGLGRCEFLRGNCEKAIVHFLSGFENATQINNKMQAFESSKYLAKSYESMGKINEALKYLKVSNMYRDSLLNDETYNKSYRIEYNYLLEKKQNQIAFLEKDKKIQQAENKVQRLYTLGLALLIILMAVIIVGVNRNRLKATKAKELILKQKNEIEIQASHLRELNQFKVKTFSILSHDLRHPVQNLSNVMDLLDDGHLSQEEFIALKNSFQNQLRQIGILLENTLNWGKSQMGGELAINPGYVDVVGLVRRNLELFDNQIKEKNLAIKVDFEDGFQVYCDPDHLDIALRNLIFNAIKFSYLGRSIKVIGKKEGNRGVLEVRDEGVGMDHDTLVNLFTIKQKQGNFGTAGEHGAGIGLLLTKEFVERNRGKLNVQSRKEVGSVFTLDFPMGPGA